MSSRRPVVGGAAVLALVGVVGLASRAHTPAGGGGTSAIDRDILLEYVLLLFAALAVVVVPLGIYLFVTGRGEETESLPARRNWMAGVFLAMVAFSVASVALLASHYFRDHDVPGIKPAANPVVGIADKGRRVPDAVRFDWAPVIVVSTLVVLGLLAGAVVLVQRRRGGSRPERVAAELALAVERTIADLRSEPDPRRAVIAAYAQMERALADAGLPRVPSEAPREYLGRVLPEVGAGAGSVERLTALFERAKFSPHTIDGAMKEEAISALESLRDDLGGSS